MNKKQKKKRQRKINHSKNELKAKQKSNAAWREGYEERKRKSEEKEEVIRNPHILRGEPIIGSFYPIIGRGNSGLSSIEHIANLMGEVDELKDLFTTENLPKELFVDKLKTMKLLEGLDLDSLIQSAGADYIDDKLGSDFLSSYRVPPIIPTERASHEQMIKSMELMRSAMQVPKEDFTKPKLVLIKGGKDE